MKGYYHDLYIGYFNDYLLCASTNPKLVKSYLKDIRKLPKHSRSIYETTLDDETIMALYSDYLLEEYVDGIFLTARDCVALDNEIKDSFKDMSEILKLVGHMRDVYAASDDLMKDTNKFDKFMEFIYNELTNSKRVNQMRTGIIAISNITSPNIGEYIRRMGALHEEHELREAFLTKLENPKE